MKEGVAFVTPDPWGMVKVIVNTLSPRKMLFLQMIRRQGHNAAYNAPPIEMGIFKGLPPGVVLCWIPFCAIVSHYTKNSKK